eukprot:TRINITY_DN11818_c0_g1_i2.p2 TRINITY_DN11818_c0_g1~~TRINITY_DN11818_c0_g1_i2.p2  ORF type:complete len:252 (-),score=119.79 TRINITY_DN11818_c0_g1_i2:250-1005(-)
MCIRDRYQRRVHGARCDKLQKALADKIKEAKDKDNKIAELLKEIEKLKLALAAMPDEDINELKERLANTEKECEDLQKSLAEKCQELEDKEAEIEELCKMIDKLKAELDARPVGDLEKLMKALEEAEKECDRLRKELKSKEEEIKDKDRQIKELWDELNRQKGENVKEFATKKDNLDRLNKLLNAKDKEIRSLEDELAAERSRPKEEAKGETAVTAPRPASESDNLSATVSAMASALVVLLSAGIFNGSLN